MPTLKELADNFCEDNDFQYVSESSKIASLTKINSENPTSIYTKLKAYPYEFEIDDKLRLASIDGIKVADSTGNSSDGNSNNSKLIKSIELTCNQESNKIKIEYSIEENEVNDEYVAILFVDNKIYDTHRKKEIENQEFYINDIKPNTDYEMYVLIVDENGDIVKSNKNTIKTSNEVFTERLMDYPILTKDGVANVESYGEISKTVSGYKLNLSKGNCTASDSMKIEAYDGDDETYMRIWPGYDSVTTSPATNNTSTYRIVKISDEMKGKKVSIKWWCWKYGTEEHRRSVLKFLDKDGNVIENYGGMINNGEERIDIFDIPSNAASMRTEQQYCSDSSWGENSKIYEIKAVK